LPRDDLPFAVSFDERSGVEIISDGLGSVPFGCGAYKLERDDCRISILLDADIFGGVYRDRIAFFPRWSGPNALHQLFLVCTNSGRTGVDQILSPKPVMSCRVIPACALRGKSFKQLS
jgi:hypothetical protein